MSRHESFLRGLDLHFADRVSPYCREHPGNANCRRQTVLRGSSSCNGSRTDAYRQPPSLHCWYSTPDPDTRSCLEGIPRAKWCLRMWQKSGLDRLRPGRLSTNSTWTYRNPVMNVEEPR